MFEVIVALTQNKRVLRVVCAYALFTVNEYSVWIAVLVYAYDKGGATEAGLIAVVQLVPAGLCAPFMAVRADRSSPTVLLLGGYAAQVAGLAMAAVAVVEGWPSTYVYAGAVVAATAITATRPAQAALLPALARTPEELTAANVAMSWVESIGVAVAGVWWADFSLAASGRCSSRPSCCFRSPLRWYAATPAASRHVPTVTTRRVRPGPRSSTVCTRCARRAAPAR